MNEFDKKIVKFTGNKLHAQSIKTFQVNVGLKCNLECVHCHVSSSPRRKEEMSWEIMEQILYHVQQVNAEAIDITGGAPEMNPNVKRFITGAKEIGLQVNVRTNLTIMLEPGYESFPEFFKAHQVHLIASLPCYLQENVDKQRGEGVYDDSIETISRLNKIGYGIDPELPLSLVYNPVGAVLPPEQMSLEEDYHSELKERYDLSFTNLFTITNMPIGRFRVDLRHENKENEYFELLENSFNADTIDPLMCRHQISVDWDGTLYDCDFNLAMRKPVHNSVPNHITQFDEFLHANREIITQDYCFGCTAGCGSSCGGALLQPETVIS